MRFIPTQIHGMLNSEMGLLLIVAPWLLGFADSGPEQRVPVILGAGAILYSLLTNYEPGVTHIIPMPVHLWLDVGSGVVLVASPWIFGFADEIWWPHLLLGLVEIGAVLMTCTTPEFDPGPPVVNAQP